VRAGGTDMLLQILAEIVPELPQPEADTQPAERAG
jgi:hypothetical protein